MLRGTVAAALGAIQTFHTSGLDTCNAGSSSRPFFSRQQEDVGRGAAAMAEAAQRAEIAAARRFEKWTKSSAKWHA
jgi:hypothetical protein